MDALPPIIAGKPVTLRRQLRERIAAGEGLLGRIDAAENVLAAISPEDLLAEFERVGVTDDHLRPAERAFWSWCRSNRRMLERFFGARGNELFDVAPSPSWPSPLEPENVASFRESISIRMAELTSVADRLGEGVAAPALHQGIDLAFLKGSALIETAVVDRLEERMRNLKDKRNVPRVLAASKELVEAVSLGALIRLGVEPPTGGDLMALAKNARKELAARVRARSPTAGDLEMSAVKFQSGLM